VIDSLVLAKVVYYEIVLEGVKVRRTRPTALDVAALGNDTVLPFLESELRRRHYSGNLMACRELNSGATDRILEPEPD
jgi:hypothetical protein